MGGFAISPSSAMRSWSAWCRSATWSSTDSPSANMNTRRCENISRPPEPRGTMAQRKSNIQAFMGLEFGFCVSAIGLDDAPASGQDRSQAAGGWKIDLGLNTQTQHLRLSWKPTRVSDVQDPLVCWRHTDQGPHPFGPA